MLTMTVTKITRKNSEAIVLFISESEYQIANFIEQQPGTANAICENHLHKQNLTRGLLLSPLI